MRYSLPLLVLLLPVILFGAFAPVPAEAAQVIYDASVNGTSKKDLVRFKETVDELRVLIVKAQEVGIVVPMQVLSLVGQDVANSVSFSLDLDIDSKGMEVVALQNFLRRHGHRIEPANGIFDATTKAQVAKFQSAEGITPSVGYFGAITRAHIERMTNP